MLQEQPKTDLVLKNLGDATYRNVLVEIQTAGEVALSGSRAGAKCHV